MGDLEDAVANDPELQAAMAPKFPQPIDYVGLAGALVPFVVSFQTSNSSSSTITTTDANGAVVTQSEGKASFKDFAALGGGALAILCALVTLTYWRHTPAARKAPRIALTLALLVLGAYQLVVRGGLLT